MMSIWVVPQELSCPIFYGAGFYFSKYFRDDIINIPEKGEYK